MKYLFNRRDGPPLDLDHFKFHHNCCSVIRVLKWSLTRHPQVSLSLSLSLCLSFTSQLSEPTVEIVVNNNWSRTSLNYQVRNEPGTIANVTCSKGRWHPHWACVFRGEEKKSPVLMKKEKEKSSSSTPPTWHSCRNSLVGYTHTSAFERHTQISGLLANCLFLVASRWAVR